MFERHFGMSSPPFQLTPDPAFYFDSPAHRAARDALAQLFSREQTFFVLTGDIGAGKTTLLLAWLADVRAAGIQVAQLTSTQLAADEVMAAVTFSLARTGVDAPHTEVDPDMALRHALRQLGVRPALVVVDEAQHLGRDALQRLVQVSDQAIQEGVTLRICLAGQNELRTCMSDPTLQALAERVQGTFHLAPLAPGDIRPYIEHRLSKAGWAGPPPFDASAFEALHRWTNGVPRRINTLCTRLLLELLQHEGMPVGAAAVGATAEAMRNEAIDTSRLPTIPAAALRPWRAEPMPRGAIVVVASGRSDHLKAVPLLRAMALQKSLPPAALVSVSDGSTWRLNRPVHVLAGLARQPVWLLHEGAPAGDLEERFEQLVQPCHPSALIVIDGDDHARCCAQVAQRQSWPVVHLGGEAEGDWSACEAASPRATIARLASLRLESEVARHDSRLARPSAAVGNVLVDAVLLALQTAERQPPPSRPLPALAQVGQRSGCGYAVVGLKHRDAGDRAPCADDVLEVLREAARDLALVWPMRGQALHALRTSGLADELAAHGIECVNELSHADFLRLLHGATCVLTDSSDVQEEAAVLGVPCLWVGRRSSATAPMNEALPGIDVGTSTTRAARALWQILFNAPERFVRPPLWDGRAGARVAGHLTHWLGPARMPGSQARAMQVLRPQA